MWEDNSEKTEDEPKSLWNTLALVIARHRICKMLRRRIDWVWYGIDTVVGKAGWVTGTVIGEVVLCDVMPLAACMAVAIQTTGLGSGCVQLQALVG